MATKIVDKLVTDIEVPDVKDPTDYKNTKAMMQYLCNKLEELKVKEKYEQTEYTMLFELVSKKYKFKSDQVLITLITRAVAFYCTMHTKKMDRLKKQLLMQLMMCMQKVLDDRTWMEFDKDGLFSNYMRYCHILKTKPRRLARYLYDAISEGLSVAAD